MTNSKEELIQKIESAREVLNKSLDEKKQYDEVYQNSILLDAQSEGISVWDRDIDRYLHSNRISVYNPLEEFLFHLPNWDGKDRIGELADRVPCENKHWMMLFHRWFLNMVAHWRGYDKQHISVIGRCAGYP